MCARRAPRRMAPAGLATESSSLRPAARTLGLLFSQPQFRFQSTLSLILSRFSLWSTGSFCWVDAVVDSYKPGDSTRKSTPHILVPITTGFWRLQRFFSWHLGIWFSSISRAGRITGWGSAGEVFSAGSYTPREFGFTCYERPWPRRNSPPAAVQRRQHGVRAQCLQTNHQRGLVQPEQWTAKTDPREAALKALVVKPKWASPASQRIVLGLSETPLHHPDQGQAPARVGRRLAVAEGFVDRFGTVPNRDGCSSAQSA